MVPGVLPLIKCSPMTNIITHHIQVNIHDDWILKTPKSQTGSVARHLRFQYLPGAQKMESGRWEML